MYKITNSDINEAIENVDAAMTVKGQVIGYAFAYGGKNIENRSQRIKPGWYALHIGGSKEPNMKHAVIYSLLGSYDSNRMPPRSAIIGVLKINGYVTESENPWFFGPFGNIVEKYIHFKEPILDIPGHQSVTYNLNTIEKKLYKRRGKREERIKSRIIKELRKFIQ